ncbi:AMP-binding enzyme [Streptomyces colonosanans]|uniref:AMP-binding enzyme C-terminal domain-containing protein n=1 Tax=Streptomyces colonosanans TaxID=1428652 RepID=A0A1S2NZ01_9ACTN|nr:hypothetical protein [Streptomyces colonosanans]OIJ86710.1 hypothetical protein BIV24_26005 [Streptomyces colonosanans]
MNQGADTVRSDVPNPLLRRILGGEPPPFALLHRAQATGADRLELMVGRVSRLASLTELPLPPRGSGGLNIYPSEIEQVIWSHPAVQDCAVIGAPHDDWGEAAVAVVELNAGARVDGGELISLCKDRLGGVRAPKQVEFVDSLPRSANGKVLKRAIRERYWAGRSRQI